MNRQAANYGANPVALAAAALIGMGPSLAVCESLRRNQARLAATGEG